MSLILPKCVFNVEFDLLPTAAEVDEHYYQRLTGGIKLNEGISFSGQVKGYCYFTQTNKNENFPWATRQPCCWLRILIYACPGPNLQAQIRVLIFSGLSSTHTLR